MSLDLTGKLIQVLDVQSGTSARGTWSRQDIIIETIEQYPRKVCVSLWGERANDIKNFKLGDTVTASINISSREVNGKWYTSVQAWRLQHAEVAETGAPEQMQQPAHAAAAPIHQASNANNANEVPPPHSSDDFSASAQVDDLPF